jgi:leucyl-tRNA synthetase
VQTGQHPRTTTEANIEIMQRQLRRLGLAHDPRRSFATIDPDYIRWTQWIFLQIFDSWYDETAPGPTAASAARARSRSSSRSTTSGARRRVGGTRRGRASRVLDTHRLAYVSETP